MGRNFKVETVHKYMYPATYNFRDEVDGTSGTDIEFITGVTTATAVIASDWQGHRKVLKCTSTGGGSYYRVYHTITPQASGTFEFWIGTTDATNSHRVYLNKGNSIAGADIGLMVWTLNDVLYITHGNGAGGTTNVNCGAIIDNQIAHVRIQFNTTTDTFSAWRDGTNYIDGENFYNDNDFGATDLDTILLRGPDVAAAIGYYDAFGLSWDTDYAIGDNVFWRHYKESEADTFEEDDVGTQGTSITWVDVADTAASSELVQEFNEHKKILRQYYSSAVGGFDYTNHVFASQSKTGWVEFWFKVSDITVQDTINLREDATIIIGFGINNSQFEVYTGGAWRQATGSPIPVNDTWYHIYIQWYDAATDTFDLFIDNVQYEDGTNCQGNQTLGVNVMWTIGTSATEYEYIDAPSCSLDGDVRADNRIFDYNSDYTKTDITTDVSNVLYSNKLHAWRTATLYSEKAYYYDEVFFLVYDINSKLALEADLTNRIQNGAEYQYPLMDKNADDLVDEKSNTFTADDIHDPTDSTSMLKVILPNVSEADGDLILVNADIKTDTYSPVTKNYPNYMMLRDISDIADSVVIIEPNGKCHLDDDLASGDSLDLDTTADKNMMIREPTVNDIIGINYYVIKGAMNPDTGTRFYKVVDNAGDDKKNTFRITNNQLRSQTDVDAYAVKLAAQLISVKEITIGTQGLGTHNMGETFNYKYVNAVLNIPQKDYYIISEGMDFDLAVSTIVLSEGIIESSKYAQTYERPENYNDSYAGQIFDTDVNTITPEIKGLGTATESAGFWVLDAVGEGVQFSFFLDEMVDTDRDIVITWGYQRTDGGADTVDITEHFAHALCDGVNQVWTTVWNAQANSLPADALTDFNNFVQTLPNANLTPNSTLYVNWKINEALKFYGVKSCVVRYYIKRSA